MLLAYAVPGQSSYFWGEFSTEFRSQILLEKTAGQETYSNSCNCQKGQSLVQNKSSVYIAAASLDVMQDFHTTVNLVYYP